MIDPDRLRDIFDSMERMFNEDYTDGYYKKSSPRFNEYNPEVYSDPYTTIYQDENNIYITIEMRSVNEDDIHITPHESGVKIEMMENGRWRNIDLDLPFKLNPDSSSVTFINGILDITLGKNNEEINI